eukprot:m.85937 g.85937  ORF g.85937 m.85937 type:complete len:151 (-) comp50895_c0_seq2:1355-1807(-)
MHLGDVQFVLFPLTDCTDSDAVGGGSHWTLLIHSKVDGCFYFFDSLPSSQNFRNAQRVARRCALLVASAADLPVKPIACAKQTNSSDCGAFVICWAEYFARWISTRPLTAVHDAASSVWKDIAIEVTQRSASEERGRLKALLLSLADKSS